MTMDYLLFYNARKNAAKLTITLHFRHIFGKVFLSNSASFGNSILKSLLSQHHVHDIDALVWEWGDVLIWIDMRRTYRS